MSKINAGNLLLNTDSYKVSMSKQYPDGTQGVYSYISSRGGLHREVVMFGLQAFIEEYLLKPFNRSDIDLAAKLWEKHGEPFPKEEMIAMYEAYGGYWPVVIKAVPEGTPVETGNVMVTVKNTDERFYWATTWVETALLRAVWYGSTVATNSREIKKIIANYLEKSGDISGLAFKLHDFGARGASSLETAGIGGAAHLVNFMGTDTMSGVVHLMNYYDADVEGFSIPASEHSTITAWTRQEEKQAYANMIKQFGKPGAIFACVSDSYDIYAACKMWCELSEDVKESGATLVVRPDSGDPIEVLPKCIDILVEGFGYYKNNKGYKVLNNVRLIWGDGINQLTIESILRVMVDVHGWSADNFAFGMGGALLQDVTRDDQKFAMKASAAFIKHKWVDVFKDPVTDKGKASLKGLVELYRDTISTEQVTLQLSDVRLNHESMMKVVYCDGIQFNKIDIETIRVNAKI